MLGEGHGFLSVQPHSKEWGPPTHQDPHSCECGYVECCKARTAVLRCFGAGAALPAARQIGAEPRRRAAQEAIITLERQHGQALALFHRTKTETPLPHPLLPPH